MHTFTECLFHARSIPLIVHGNGLSVKFLAVFAADSVEIRLKRENGKAAKGATSLVSQHARWLLTRIAVCCLHLELQPTFHSQIRHALSSFLWFAYFCDNPHSCWLNWHVYALKVFPVRREVACIENVAENARSSVPIHNISFPIKLVTRSLWLYGALRHGFPRLFVVLLGRFTDSGLGDCPSKKCHLSS